MQPTTTGILENLTMTTPKEAARTVSGSEKTETGNGSMLIVFLEKPIICVKHCMINSVLWYHIINTLVQLLYSLFFICVASLQKGPHVAKIKN